MSVGRSVQRSFSGVHGARPEPSPVKLKLSCLFRRPPFSHLLSPRPAFNRRAGRPAAACGYVFDGTRLEIPFAFRCWPAAIQPIV